MVSSNVRSSAENLKGEFRGYAKRDRTGDMLYTVYEDNGFYHFYTQDGKNLHTHSIRMGLSTEGFYPCQENGSNTIVHENRERVATALEK